MRTTLVTAILLGSFVPAVMAEGDGRQAKGDALRPGGGEGQQGGKRMEMERREHPSFRNPGEMFERMDKDRDGNITKEEFFSAQRLERLPEEKRERFFSRLDRDNDGMISKEEIRAMRQDAERRSKDEFRQLDANRSGGLDFAEFSKGEFFGKLPEAKRRQIFDRMDTDSNGEITAEDRPKGPPHRKQ
jgi:Ca2+-binding EF-hand superfamily protein